MYEQLPTYLSSALVDMQALLSRNPQHAARIQAKIALLQRRTLITEMNRQRTFEERMFASVDGRNLQVAALFPDVRMRDEASLALARIGQALPLLEEFMQRPFPGGGIRLWYGFVVGNSGGNGVVDIEDRSSYDMLPGIAPYDAILGHELAHSYIGNETLTQFLEMYVYNRLLGRGEMLDSWTFTRGYSGMNDMNQDSALVLDVYLLVGPRAMSSAYAAASLLGAPYGQPLPTLVVEAFVERAPIEARPEIRSKLLRIDF
jgi:hypothetical protein